MDIYEALKKDHLEVKELLSELLALDKDDDYRMVLIEQIEKALIPHARAEESVFYNTIRAVNSDNSKVMHSYREHMEAESLLRMLQVKDKADFDWKETAIKLKDSLEHHIEEEENTIFAVARSIFTPQEAAMMTDAFEQLKAEVGKEGFMKTSFDMVVNLLPPRFVDKIRNLKSPDSSAKL